MFKIILNKFTRKEIAFRFILKGKEHFSEILEAAKILALYLEVVNRYL